MTETANSSHYVGQVVKAVAARCESRMTEAPPRYTQDTLVADMLAAHKFAKTEQEKVILRETEGLGTSRTREPTITGLIRRGFFESKKRGKRHEVVSTDMAKVTISALPEILTGVATTARWEVAFKMIEQGTATPEKVRGHLKANLDHIVGIAKGSIGQIKMPIGNSVANKASSGNSKAAVGVKPAVKTIGGAVKKWF